MRILIASDEPCFTVGLARGYALLGHEVLLGAQNFVQRLGTFDIVHFLWPEEYTCRQEPDDSTLAGISDALDWWGQRARLLISVNNFYPHGLEGNPAYRQLYGLFYSKCHAIHHFSNASREAVCREWPAALSKPQAVTTGFNYEHLLRCDADRTALRDALGVNPGDMVVLVFGTLRKWDEVRLIMKAVSAAHVPNLRLLIVARYSVGGLSARAWLKRKMWDAWCRWHRAITVGRFVPDEQVYRYLMASDVVLVPRINDLSSALPALAMTFGRMVIAPNHGAFPEYLAGSRNLLYESGIARSLAAAIRQAAASDREEIGRENRQLAAAKPWSSIAEVCLKLVRDGV